MAIITMIIRYDVDMGEGSTKTMVSTVRSPKDVRPVDVDHIDRRILTALHADARMSNSALAELVGIAPSTCHGRVRRLQDLGVIRGFYADIDPAAIGLNLQAMISVSLQSNARGKIRNFIGQIRRKPQVMDVYFLAGADDFILHVAARDTDDLRSFVVENLNADADVAGTQTSLIFEHLRGASPL
jgi:DNA-binding Lrp family transcriptional regulator